MGKSQSYNKRYSNRLNSFNSLQNLRDEQINSKQYAYLDVIQAKWAFFNKHKQFKSRADPNLLLKQQCEKDMRLQLDLKEYYIKQNINIDKRTQIIPSRAYQMNLKVIRDKSKKYDQDHSLIDVYHDPVQYNSESDIVHFGQIEKIKLKRDLAKQKLLAENTTQATMFKAQELIQKEKQSNSNSKQTSEAKEVEQKKISDLITSELSEQDKEKYEKEREIKKQKLEIERVIMRDLNELHLENPNYRGNCNTTPEQDLELLRFKEIRDSELTRRNILDKKYQKYDRPQNAAEAKKKFK